jgi:hypothetical protein
MIPDDEPWWMVRRDASTDETLNHLDALNFRPFGYEW